MLRLTDKEIRKALVSSLARRAFPPSAILEEVQVCNGRAIADVVAVYKSMHCYEIKGETDSINRIVQQAAHYNLAFPVISLVTTKNHCDRAVDLSHKHWGVVLASAGRDGKVTLRHIRPASRNPLYNPEMALLSLWRSELLNFPLPASISMEKMNRQKMAEAIAKCSPAKIINESLGSALAARRRRTMQDSLEPCR